MNSSASIELIRDDTPFFKCQAGLKLGGRSRGTGRLLEFSPIAKSKYNQWDNLPTFIAPCKSLNFQNCLFLKFIIAIEMLDYPSAISSKIC